MTRLRGRCPRGRRLVAKVPHGHWKMTTFVAGLRNDHMTAPFVVDAPMNGEIFLSYLEQCLVSTLAPGEIVMMDNLPAHKVAGMRETIEAKGATLRRLPPYSPDLNPIEQSSPKSKPICARLASDQSMNAAMTAQLVTDALVMAIWRRGKPDALLHHSDRGSQYSSEQFQRLMADHGVVCSMSRSGNVWDNAAMESFFSSLKTERTAGTMYRSRDDTKADVFDYIERFYNPKRRHSTIGYLSPMEFERQAGLA